MKKSELVYTNFTMDRLDQAIKMVADSFQTNNFTLKDGLETRKSLETRSQASIKNFYRGMNKLNLDNNTQYQLLKALLYRGQLVAFAMTCELHIYIDDTERNINPRSSLSQIFKIFNKADYPKNTTLFGSLLAVHKDYMKENLSTYLLERAIAEWYSYGFKTIAGIITNPISLKVFERFGGKVIGEIKVKRKGKVGVIYAIKADVNETKWKPRL